MKLALRNELFVKMNIIKYLDNVRVGKGLQCLAGTSKVSPQQRTRVQMSPEAQNDIKMHFYDFYQINLYVFNKFQIYFINYSGF